MKYLKLFEKFESLKLSKTLSFLKDKSGFISELKSISGIKDIPLSNFTDDMFQYMPFKKALKFLKKPDPEICQTCSGEGKYRRPWGKGTRLVKCSDCDSTGKISPTSSTISHLKFWFSSEGQYVGKTCTTGEVYVRSSIKSDGKEYTKGPTFTCRELTREAANNQSRLETGDKVWMELNYRMVVATIFKQDNHIFFIQNESSYGEPNGTDWKKYGSRSYMLSYLPSSRIITTLRPKEDGYSDPKDYNFWVTSRFVPNKEESIDSVINKADFALILDMSKIPAGGLKNLKDKRAEQKIGIPKTDDEIRNINLKRYLSKLSQSFKISDDLSSINRIPSRIFGRSRSSFFIYSGEFLNIYSAIITNYYKAIVFLESGDTSSFKYYEDVIKSQLDKAYNKISSRSVYLNKNIIDLKKSIIDSSLDIEKKEYITEFIQLMEDLGTVIESKVLSRNLETIFDMEVSLQKITSIMNIMTSERYKTSGSSASYVMTYLTKDYPVRNILSEINYLSNSSLKALVDDTKKIIQIVNRM